MKIPINNRRQTLQQLGFRPLKLSNQFDYNLCSIKDFKQRLAIEKRRSERSSYTSSIIFFNAKPILARNGKHPKLRLDDIAKLICANIRFTDVGMIYKKQTILILLPDTSYCGAQCVCKRMVDKITNRYVSILKLSRDDFHFKILSFPAQKIENVTPDNLETKRDKVAHIGMSAGGHISKGMVFKQDNFINQNFCVSSFNGSAISMRLADVFFWDQQLVSKYFLTGKHFLKRIIDILGALAALVLFLPIMAVIAVGVKSTSPGPILFKQRRVGHKGQYFTFLKFRSMFIENEDSKHREFVKKLINGENDQINNGSNQNPLYKIENDARVTPFGKFLRKTSMDELPQLFNVLKGEMSLVGPRPPIPYEVKEYKNWHLRRTLEVKPGITGLWQVSGRSRTTFDEMVRLDIRYAENWSVLMDFKILFKTIKVVFKAEGK